MISVLRRRDFALLWSGGMISLTGDWMLLAALPFYVYARSGSALAASGTFAILGLPWLLFGSVAGVFADRWDRRRTMISCDAVRTVLLLGLLLVPATGQLWPIYVVTFVETSIGTLFGPARNALIPSLVEESELMPANSLRVASDNVGRLIGPSIGGALLVGVGFSGVVLADSLSYLSSALAIALVHAPRRESRQVVGARSALHAVWLDWKEGFGAIGKDRVLSVLFLAAGVAILGDSLLTGVLVPFIKGVVHTDARGFGWLMSARGLGGLIGSVVVGFLAFMRPSRMLTLSLTLLGMLILAATVFRPLAAEALFFALAGLPGAAWFVAEETLLQTRVDDRLLGRVFATFGASAGVLAIAGMMISGALVGSVGAIPVMYATAAFYLVAGTIGLLLFPTERGEAALAPAVMQAAEYERKLS